MKCRVCGQSFEPSRLSGIGSILGAQFGFEISMLLLGGYTAVCLYSFQSIFALAVSLAVGAVILALALPRWPQVCEKCKDQGKFAGPRV